jgi:hypothetical protein
MGSPTSARTTPHGKNVMINKVLYGLIILTTAVLTLANLALQEYLIAALAVGLGSLWLILQIKKRESLNSGFFVFFLGLTISGSLRNVPILYMLFALSSNLAAWDLSRFRARIANEVESEQKTLLELKHLQKLTITVSIGFLVTLLPLFVHISTSFITFLCIILAVMLTFRRSIFYLRNENKTNA